MRRGTGKWRLPAAGCAEVSNHETWQGHAFLFRIALACIGTESGVADEWVTQLLRQGDAKVFKKYSQMKLQMKREALAKLNRQANESGPGFGTVQGQSERGFGTVLAQ